MGLSMDFSGIKDADNLHGGGGRPKPGRGMVLITEFTEYTGNNSEHEMTIEIVAWCGIDGKKCEESVTMEWTIRLKTKDNTGKGHPQKVMAALGVAGGLFMPADIVAWNTAQVAPDIDFTQLVGRPIMLVLVEEPKKDNPKESWLNVGSYGKGFFHIRDPQIKDWPINTGVFNSKAALVGDYTPNTPRHSTDFDPSQMDSGKPASENPFASNA